METADTFIIVQGPRGSGKRELVLDQALKDTKYKLLVDCKPIQEARGHSATINAAAASVGYKPVFSWMNSISGMVDMAAQVSLKSINFYKTTVCYTSGMCPNLGPVYTCTSYR